MYIDNKSQCTHLERETYTLSGFHVRMKMCVLSPWPMMHLLKNSPCDRDDDGHEAGE